MTPDRIGLYDKFVLKAFIATLFVFILSVNTVIASELGNKVEQPSVVKVSSSELFWPITAGAVMGEMLYPLKSLKENLRGLIIFGNVKKADYLITLSEKRLIEAEKLLVEKKDYNNGRKSLEESQLKAQEFVKAIEKSEAGGEYVVEVKLRAVRSLEKQKALGTYLATQVPDEQKEIVKKNLADLDTILAKML